MRELIFILMITVSILASISCNKTTCEKWDKPEFGSRRGMDYYKHSIEGCESLGFCDCFKGVRSENVCLDEPIRMNIYMPEKNRCYPVFSKGPCKRKEWLIFDNQESIGKCVTNPCFPRGKGRNRDFWFYDPRIGQCLQVYQSDYCPAHMVLLPVHDSPYPQCAMDYGCSIVSGINVLPPSSLECRPGTRYNHYIKKCRVTRISSLRLPG